MDEWQWPSQSMNSRCWKAAAHITHICSYSHDALADSMPFSECVTSVALMYHTFIQHILQISWYFCAKDTYIAMLSYSSTIKEKAGARLLLTCCLPLFIQYMAFRTTRWWCCSEAIMQYMQVDIDTDVLVAAIVALGLSLECASVLTKDNRKIDMPWASIAARPSNSQISQAFKGRSVFQVKVF